MNYLGHLYLSGNNKQLLLGNFIGDFVKGKQYLNYPNEIKKGILLLRRIDEYTDRNPHWMEIRTVLKPSYKRYSGVVADLFVDHFLAANWKDYSHIQLSWYTKWVHAILLQNHQLLPLKLQGVLPFLIQHKRLQSYAQINGLENSLSIMAKHTSLPDHSQEAIELLKNNYEMINEYSHLFIQEVSGFI
jgi:acyl carrier protein phosphodiesterase